MPGDAHLGRPGFKGGMAPKKPGKMYVLEALMKDDYMRGLCIALCADGELDDVENVTKVIDRYSRRNGDYDNGYLEQLYDLYERTTSYFP